MPSNLSEARARRKEEMKSLIRTVNGREHTFYPNTRYVSNIHTNEMRAANPVFLDHPDWVEYLPVEGQFVTSVKGASYVQLQELEELQAEHAALQEQHEELKGRWRSVIDSKLELESQYDDLLRRYQALRGAPEDMPDEDLPSLETLENIIADGIKQKNSRKLAQKAISVFQTPRALLNAGETDFLRIDGFGPAKAEQAWKALHPVGQDSAPEPEPEAPEVEEPVALAEDAE